MSVLPGVQARCNSKVSNILLGLELGFDYKPTSEDVFVLGYTTTTQDMHWS